MSRKASANREATSLAIAAKIRAARREAGLSLAEVEKACGIAGPTVSALEHATHFKVPTVYTLTRLAEGMGAELIVEFRF